MNIDLRIERLILDGVDGVEPNSAAAVQGAVEAELARLLTERGVGSPRGGALAYVRAADIAVPSRSDAAGLGRHIGAAVHEGLVHR
jgi:hypothetical protein